MSAAGAPFVQLDQGTVELGWMRTPEGSARASATLRGPTLRVAFEGGKGGGGKSKRPTFPLDVDRLSVKDGAIVFISPDGKGQELLRIHGLELTVENFTTRRAASGAKQTSITASGRIGKAGRFSMTVSADPTRSTPDFSGSAEINGLQLREVSALVDKRFTQQPLTAKVTLALDFTVRGGQLTGTARPTLSDVGIGVGGAGSGVFEELGQRLPQQFGVKLPGPIGGPMTSKPLSATIPIRGKLRADAPLWTALADVLRTSFVEAMSAGFLQRRSPGVGS